MIIAGQYTPRQHMAYTPFQIDHNFLADRLQKQEQIYAAADDMMSKYPNYLEGDKEDRDVLIGELKEMQKSVVSKYESGDMLSGNKKLYSAMRDVTGLWKEGGKAYHMQANFNSAQEWQKEQRERLQKGEINQFQYYASVKDSLENFKTFGPDGQINNFSGRSRMNYVDADKFMSERLKLFQEQYSEEYGPPTRENGYLVWRKVGKKEIREEDLIKGLSEAWINEARKTGQLQDEYRYKKDSGMIDTKPEDLLVPFKKKSSEAAEGLAIMASAKTPEEQLKALSQVSGLLDKDIYVDSDHFLSNEDYRAKLMESITGVLDVQYKSNSADYEAGRSVIDSGDGEGLVYNLWEKDLAQGYAQPYALMGRKLEIKVEQDIKEDIYEKMRLQSLLNAEKFSYSMRLAEYKSQLGMQSKIWMREFERAQVLDRSRGQGPVVGNHKLTNPVSNIGELEYNEAADRIKFPGAGFMWRKTDTKTYDRAEGVFKMWLRDVATDEIKSQVKGFDHKGQLVKGGPGLDGSLYHQEGAVARSFINYFNNNYVKAQLSAPIEGDMAAQTPDEQRQMGTYAFGIASQGADIYEIDPKSNSPRKISYDDFMEQVNTAHGRKGDGGSGLMGNMNEAPLLYHFRTTPYNTVELPSGMYVTMPETKGGGGQRRYIIGDTDKNRTEMYRPLQQMFSQARRHPETGGIVRDSNGNVYVYRPRASHNGEVQPEAQLWRSVGNGMYSPLIRGEDGAMKIDETFSSNLALDAKGIDRLFDERNNAVRFNQADLLKSFDQAYAASKPADATRLNLERTVEKEKTLLANPEGRYGTGRFNLEDIEYYDD